MSEPNWRKSLRVVIIVGVVALGVILTDAVAGLLGFSFLPASIRRLLLPTGILMVGLGVALLQQRENSFDERFLLHRLKATRAAAVAGLLGMGLWLTYDLLAREILHWEIIAILGLTAAVKLGLMAYYQWTQ